MAALGLGAGVGCGPAGPSRPGGSAGATTAGPVRPTATDGRYTLLVRSTHYFAGEAHGDPDTDAGRSLTGVPLREATATAAGVCAVDPAIIPYGSRIAVPTASGPRWYVAADTGGAVRRETASGGAAPVVDFYSPTQVGRDWQAVTIVPYTSAVPFVRLTAADRRAVLDRGTGP